MAPALEASAASVEVPQPPGLEAALAKRAAQVSLNPPTQDPLASFGNEWEAALTKAVTEAGVDSPQARTAFEAGRPHRGGGKRLMGSIGSKVS